MDRLFLKSSSANLPYLLFLTFCTLILATLAAPNQWLLWGNSVLGSLAYVPWFYALIIAKKRVHVSIISFLLGFCFIFTQTFWLGFMKDYGPLILATVSVTNALIYLLGAQFFGYFLSKRSIFSPLLFAASWVIFEYIRSVGLIAFPWNYIFYPFHNFLAINQVVSVFGVWALSFIVAYGQACVALFLRESPHPSSKIHQNYAYFFGALLLIFWFYGQSTLDSLGPPTHTLSTVAIQANQDPWLPKFSAEADIIKNYLRLYEQAQTQRGSEPDLVIWSEGNILAPASHPRYRSFPPDQPLALAIEESSALWLIGTRFSEGEHAYHGVALSGQDNLLIEKQYKVNLVPFAEGNPLEALGIGDFLSSQLGFSFFSYGKEITIFEVPNQENRPVFFAVPICFEDAFPEINRLYKRLGAQLLINLTDDSWSATSSAEIQHFITSRYRSVELRLPMLRSTNSGFTVLLDPYGRILASLPLFEEGILDLQIPIFASTQTFYYLFGDWLIALLTLIILFYFFEEDRQRKKQ